MSIHSLTKMRSISSGYFISLGSGILSEGGRMQIPDEYVIWRKSRRCATSSCVEVSFRTGEVLLRDSKDPDGPRLAISRSTWDSFLSDLRAGHYDLTDR
jgi:hypothetical protein